MKFNEVEYKVEVVKGAGSVREEDGVRPAVQKEIYEQR
jgi:hypothetical protein